MPISPTLLFLRGMVFASQLVLLAGLPVAPASAQAAPTAAVASPPEVSANLLNRGRYVVLLSHCNNCHTAGYSGNEGRVPEERWLAGNPIGWRSRNGTTYASNLRLYMQSLGEDDWLRVAKGARMRPPMPWWTLRDTSDDDLRAMYHYIRSLSPVGKAAPEALPAEIAPPPPFNQLPDMSIPR